MNAYDRAELRFMAFVSPEPTSGCWLWMGCLNHAGYGGFRVNDKTIRANRAAWIMFRGSIPGEAHVLHHCDVSACVNPSHLYLGTHQDNMSDKVKRGRQSRTGNPAMRAKTHCPSGHPYFGDNLLIYRGRRYCVTCNKVHNAERYARLVAARKAA